MSEKTPQPTFSTSLVDEIKTLIHEGRQQVAQAINAGLTATYWHIGKRINEDILQHSRAGYGEQVVQTLSAQLVKEFGSGWSSKHLRHCLHFAETFPEFQIVSTLWRQLSWSHFKIIMYRNSDLERDFYAQMCRLEKWSVRTLRTKIDSMLFERTAISKKPEELARQELAQLKAEDILTPDLVFRDHYVLDFLGLKDTYAEKDLETAILRELEQFILELGIGFTFVARQKRMSIDANDFFLDLLFYHRKLKRLVAIELKIGEFKAAYKGQMELYLRWLEKYETEPDEEQPIGLILCAKGHSEQIELLQLDKANIKVAEYITQYLPKELLVRKLHDFSVSAQHQLENRSL